MTFHTLTVLTDFMFFLSFSLPSGRPRSVVLFVRIFISLMLYTFCAIILRNYKLYIWAGHVARMGEDRGVHRVLVGKPEGRRPLGRPRCRWEDNIKVDLQEVGGGRGDWMELAQNRDRWRALVGTVRDFRVP